MKKFTSLIALAGIFFQKNYSQCPTADAGPDKIICIGNSTTIGTPAQSGVTYKWSPTTGLSNPNIAQPICSPSSTTLYTLTASTTLLQNGDFELGSTGFSSDYLLHPQALEPPSWGRFLTGTNPNNIHFPWCNITNNTPGGSLMFMADGSQNSTNRMWFQNVPVTTNTNYTFSGWAYALTNPNTSPCGVSIQCSNPILNVQVNGQIIISNLMINYSNCTGGWIFFSATWNSQNNTTALVEIRSEAITTAANDIALDDLYFGINCPISTDDVLVNVSNNTPTISPAGPITYYNQYETAHKVQFSASASSSYQWYKNGQAIQGATNQVLTITCQGLLTYSDNYYVATACGISNTVTFNYIGCDEPSDYPVTIPGSTVCATQLPMTVYAAPISGSNPLYRWWGHENPSCLIFNPAGSSTNSTSLTFNSNCGIFSEGVYTLSTRRNSGEQIYMYYIIPANPNCRIINPSRNDLKPDKNMPQVSTNSLSNESIRSKYFLDSQLVITTPAKTVFFPNPANTIITFKSRLNINYITILDLLGAVVLESKVNGSGSFTLDVSRLKGGIYTCRIETSNGMEYLKLSIQR